MTIPEREPLQVEIPTHAQPRFEEDLEPELVPYPGLGVHFVANVKEETYSYRARYYCYLHGRWFMADAFGGPWEHVSMKYVPVSIYRVRGHLPPALEKLARDDRSKPKVSLVSFQLVPPK